MKKNYKSIITKIKVVQSAMLLACLSMGMSYSVHAVVVDLGSLTFASAIASAEQAPFNAASSIDGNLGGFQVGNGWKPGSDLSTPATITWTLQNSPSPNLAEGERVDHYTYTLNLHYGWANNHSLRSFSIAAGDSSTNLNQVNNFISLSTTGINTISADASGVITTTEAQNPDQSLLDTHTLVFTSNAIVNTIRLTTSDTNHGWATFGNFVLAEATGSASAEVVPEPSTFALIASLITLIYVVGFRKKQ